MTFGTDREPTGPTSVEDFIAREHWAPIAESVLFQSALLAVTAAVLAVPPGPALSLVHLMGLIGATVGAVVTGMVAGRGDRERAAVVARRAVASLIVSALALAGLVVMWMAGG